MFLPVQPGVVKGDFTELADGVGFASCNHKIIRLFLLQHQPHGFHIFPGVPPIPLGVEIPQEELVL